MGILQLGNAGYILHEAADQYYGAGAGYLSIKSFFHGTAYYQSGTAHYAADDSTYLVLNQDQPYSIEINSSQAVESFCVFFAPEFTRMVLQSLDQSIDQSLDFRPASAGNTPLFFDRTYPHDTLLSPFMLKLRVMCTHSLPETGWLAEQMHDLLKLLLKVHAGVKEEALAIPSARSATRVELYRRLHYAKDYADAYYSSPITIDQMAEAAGISPNHLLRMFRQVFHQSPYQYITAKRLEAAKNLLRQTDMPVTEICLAIGFESLGSFSTMFRRKAGLSPVEYRTQALKPGDFEEVSG